MIRLSGWRNTTLRQYRSGPPSRSRIATTFARTFGVFHSKVAAPCPPRLIGMSEQVESRTPTSQLAPLSPEEGIWRLATALAAAASPTEVAAALAEQGAAAAGASFSNMAVLTPETGRVRVVHGSVMDPTIAARWEEFELSDPTPLCEAMMSRRAVLIESLAELVRRYPDMVVDTAAASIGATASYPLLSAAGLVLGAVGFGWPSPQEVGSQQVRHLDLVANLAAQA